MSRMTNRNRIWWAKCFFHNWIVHPILPFADIVDAWGPNRFSQAIYDLHDNSYPEGGG